METKILDNAYNIKTVGFEGPFGLLLNLIEERKLFINDLSLAQVTEDYLKYIGELGKSNPGEISSFIVVAATLILIKSKSLLPNLDLTSEEEGDIKNLEDRLKLYELYARLGGNIKSIFGRKIIFVPLERKNDILVFLPDDRITKESMMTFAEEVLGRMPKKISLPEVEVRKVISLEEMIDNLTQRIQNSLKMNFSDFAPKGRGKLGEPITKEEKINMIVGFLAMLEMVRQGMLQVAQENNFGDIIMEKQVK